MTTDREAQERRSGIRALLLWMMWQMPAHPTLEEMPDVPVLSASTEWKDGRIAEEMTPEAYFRLLREFDLMDYHVRLKELSHEQ